MWTSTESSAGRIAFAAALISLAAGWWFGLSASAMLVVALGVVALVLLWPLISMALVAAFIGACVGLIEFGGWIAGGVLWMTGHDMSKFKGKPTPTDSPEPP